ncbi:inhibitor of the pro-sigma K processing machinery [Melghirimyces thermohalophilus]|uniref:Inhibitor of the pro-sigma K processing machinery n=1 Tax=Melghirimyces thermohalophilus TaxID=1236220 RepID=A0A1G6QWE2_9BACL|nr:pro-sigmaK processing inhibitor BofA family protein [Melghirimyces thermohalophilus]SDC96581.1 inhibitor of the pro-sigma K processing machinery [Melghirimyces thermohalophilus]
MELQWWMAAAVAGVVIFMVVSRSLTKPIRWIWYSLVYTAVGAVVLFLLNLAGEWINFRIPVNPVTSLITGLLGLPGLVCLIVVKVFLIGG